MHRWGCIAGFGFGLLFASVLQNTTLWPRASAAPADVFGSANVAVDTYRNRKGTYVIWSNGRVTDVSNPAADLGHPFRDPPGDAHIAAAKKVEGNSLGSPNVAVKALTRGDATYVLFSDGSIKLPANADAAAPAAIPGRVVVWNSAPGQYPYEGWTVQESEFSLRYSGGTFTVTLEEPMQGKRNATAVFTAYSLTATVTASVGLQGRFSGDGKTITFYPGDLGTGHYNPAANRPVGFQFVATAE